ncbi:unnamed protein product, partial [Pleuronectes platessa]
TQVAWQDLGEKRQGEKHNSYETRETERGGGESLWSVWRKDCGKLRMEHPWSLALYAEGTRRRNFRASCSLGFSREVCDPHQAACRHSSSHPQCKDSQFLISTGHILHCHPLHCTH